MSTKRTNFSIDAAARARRLREKAAEKQAQAPAQPKVDPYTRMLKKLDADNRREVKSDGTADQH